MTAPDPLFLATAVEAVLRAGDIQLSQFGTPLRIDQKGSTDLVTQGDLPAGRERRSSPPSSTPRVVSCSPPKGDRARDSTAPGFTSRTPGHSSTHCSAQ